MDSELKQEVERLYAKYIEVLTRVEALEEELRGMIQDVYEGLSEHGIYIN